MRRLSLTAPPRLDAGCLHESVTCGMVTSISPGNSPSTSPLTSPRLSSRSSPRSSPRLVPKTAPRKVSEIDEFSVCVSARDTLASSFEEALLVGRLSKVGCKRIPGFSLDMGICSQDPCRSPSHIRIPFEALLYAPGCHSESCPSPFVGNFDITDGCAWPGYKIPPFGKLQFVVFNPEKTPIKRWFIPYDVRQMPKGCKTIIRQKVMANGKTVIRSACQFRIVRPKSNRYYLYGQIRLVFHNRTDEDEFDHTPLDIIHDLDLDENDRYVEISDLERKQFYGYFSERLSRRSSVDSNDSFSILNSSSASATGCSACDDPLSRRWSMDSMDSCHVEESLCEMETCGAESEVHRHVEFEMQIEELDFDFGSEAAWPAPSSSTAIAGATTPTSATTSTTAASTTITTATTSTIEPKAHLVFNLQSHSSSPISPSSSLDCSAIENSMKLIR
eukprot:GILK01009608.1.p1 GENE.GILK01009608.1~~GILK01009608.1.p1  ORF type:complete len:446 (-),score=27.08 GILK01009608.1:95-1432(-)